VTFNDFCSAAHLPEDTPIEKFCTRNLVTVFPADDLSLAQKKMGIRDIGRIVVVDRDDPRLLRGILTRRDVIEAYEQAKRRKKSDDLMSGGMENC
jgi:CIC family chloride channel protein